MVAVTCYPAQESLFDKEVREGFASWFVLVYGAHVLCTVTVNGCLYYGILAYFDLTA